MCFFKYFSFKGNDTYRKIPKPTWQKEAHGGRHPSSLGDLFQRLCSLYFHSTKFQKELMFCFRYNAYLTSIV